MKKFFLLACLAASFMTASCRKDVPPETEFLPKTESVSAPAEGGDFTIEYVLANPVSGGSVEASSGASWISDFDCSGSGTVKFKVDPNYTSASRSDEVLVEYGELNFSVPVTQAGLTLPEADTDVTCTEFLGIYYGDAYDTYTHFLMLSDIPTDNYGNFNPEGTYYVIYLTRNIDKETAGQAFTAGQYDLDPESGYADWTISASDSYVFSGAAKHMLKEGSLYVSGDIDNSVFELTFTLDDGSVHHAVYRGAQQGIDYSIDWVEEDIDMTAADVTASYIEGEGDADYKNANINISMYSALDDNGWVEVPGYNLILVGNVEYDASGHVVPGTYSISSDDMLENEFESGYCTSMMNSPFPVGSNIRYFYVDQHEQKVGLVVSGTVEISGSGNNYTVECELVTREGVKIHATYTGALEVNGAPNTDPYTEYYLTGDHELSFPSETSDKFVVNGMAMDYLYDDAVAWDITFMQYDDSWSYDKDYLVVQIICPAGYTEEPMTGTYTMAQDDQKGTPGTVTPGIFEPGVKENMYRETVSPTYCKYFEDGDLKFGAAATGGELKLTKNPDGTYTIEFDFADQQAVPKHFSCSWTGKINIF